MSGASSIKRISIKIIDLITDATDKYRGIRAHHVTSLTALYLVFVRRQEIYFLACVTLNNPHCTRLIHNARKHSTNES